MVHGFEPPIKKSQQCIVEYPVSGYSVMEILGVVASLVKHKRGDKKLPMYEVKTRYVHKNGNVLPFWFLQILSPMNNL